MIITTTVYVFYMCLYIKQNPSEWAKYIKFSCSETVKLKVKLSSLSLPLSSSMLKISKKPLNTCTKTRNTERYAATCCRVIFQPTFVYVPFSVQVSHKRQSGDDAAVLKDQIITLVFVLFKSSMKTIPLSTTHTHSQMVFYIEACESGSMMNHLPADIDGELNFTSSDSLSSKTKR